MRSLIPLLIALALLSACRPSPPGRDDAPPPPAELAKVWDAEHVTQPAPPLLVHADVMTRVDRVVAATPDLFAREVIGQSVERRAIVHVSFGSGPRHVLLWSQMHGDEPTATAALFDVFEYVRRHRNDPLVSRLLARLTLHVVPMLNPDGAERFRRRNAQGLDVNRDALLLQSPEGRALKALRDRLNPVVGFNLHNQSWQTSAGRPPKPATISLLSVAFDEARTVGPGRTLTKKICAIVRDALEPLAPGQIARYDDEFEVRAFGDNITKWGTSVVLIETGPYAGPEPDRALVRLNFVALVTALDALASGYVNAANPARYESLPVNESRMLHTIIKGGSIWTGTGAPPFTGDVGIAASRRVWTKDGVRTLGWSARIDDIGDLRVYGALETVDASGLTVAPLFAPAAGPGDRVRLPGPVAGEPPPGAPRPPTIQVGEAGALLLLRPADEPGIFLVERVIKVE